MSDQLKILASAIKRQQALKINDCFDPVHVSSRPTKSQQAILNDLGKVQFRYAVAANQAGKSQLGAREVSWIFNETHPSWVRPERWGSDPLLIIVVARTTKQIEENLWRKIAAFLDPSTYQVQRIGGIIQKVTHRDNKNTIVFASHHSENEAREKLQGFVAHYVWLDEMPGSVQVIEELHRRVQSRQGYFLATFTPKVRNDEIRKLVEACREPMSKQYKMLMFDNPALTQRDKEAIVQSLETYPESYRRTVLYGDWSAGELAVYDFASARHVASPANYSKGWRHVVAVDPAMSGKAGVILWAEHPETGVWFTILADYVEGCQAPDDVVKTVEGKVQGYNIVRRISDPHEVWFIGAASKLGYVYLGVYKKSDRKNELIKNLQTALTDGKIKISPWCTLLIDEFVECHWSETAEGKIANSSKFHLLDCAQYFIDLKPKNDWVKPNQTFDQVLRQADKERVKQEFSRLTVIKGGVKHRKQWKIRA